MLKQLEVRAAKHSEKGQFLTALVAYKMSFMGTGNLTIKAKIGDCYFKMRRP